LRFGIFGSIDHPQARWCRTDFSGRRPSGWPRLLPAVLFMVQWPWQILGFGRDPRSSDSLRARQNFVCFCHIITHDFTDFPSAKFHEILTQHVYRCRDESFRNRSLKKFPIRDRFSRKRKKMNFFPTYCDFRPP